MTATIYNDRMAKQGKPSKSTPKDAKPERPGWHTRLSDRYKVGLQRWAKKFQRETGVTPDLVNGIQLALDAFFEQHGINPDEPE